MTSFASACRLSLASLVLTAGLSSSATAQALGDDLLTDPHFNSTSQPLLPFLSSDLDRWLAEVSTLVTGLQMDGGAPFEGDGMLRIRRAPANVSQVRQRVDVSAFATEIDGGGATATASAWCRATLMDIGGSGRIRAFDANQNPLATSGNMLIFNLFNTTWNPHEVSMQLPPGTRFIELQFAVTNTTIPVGESVYCDDSSLVVTATDFTYHCKGNGGDLQGCTDCPCGNNAPVGSCGGCLNSVGLSARILASGQPIATGSFTNVPLRIDATGLPPGQPALLFSGSALTPIDPPNPCIALGSGVLTTSSDGLRCVATNLLRHGIKVADATGEIGLTNSGWGLGDTFFSYEFFVPTEVRYFQVWYRDSISAVCGNGTNTTDAVRVEFTH